MKFSLRRSVEASVAARARRAGFVLLLLALHAAQSGATHFHRPALARLQSAPSGIASVHVGDSARYARDTAGHAQCLLCRLQRDLSASLRDAAPAALEPPHSSRIDESADFTAHRGTPAGVSRGRAPPPA